MIRTTKTSWVPIWWLLLAFVQVSWAVPLWSEVCTHETTKDLPFCDTTRDRNERIRDYVQRVPIEVKIAMMGHNASGYEDLRIPPYMWWSEGLHGPLEPCVEYKDRCVCPTNFPSPSAMGNAFNRTLYGLVGGSIGIQGRAISNLRVHDRAIGDGLTYWSPTINLQRDPRWGRNQEVPGEDPFLTGEYSRAFVQALQGTKYTTDEKENSDLQMAACCKHFLANSLERWKTYDRHSFNAKIDDYDLHNYYLPPFEECTKHAVGVMCSYNALNGVPTCASDWLLKDVLRDRMNFTGYIVTDCGALSGVVHGHHFAIDEVQASAFVKNATVDVNCGSVFQDSLPKALSEGMVEEATIHESFERMARIQFRLGLFDSTKKETFDPETDLEAIDSPDDQRLALEAALQSIVLLQNNDKRLPLDLEGIQSLAIIGPHIHAKGALMGNYHGAKCTCRSDGSISDDYSCLESPLEAIERTLVTKNKTMEVTAVEGCGITDGNKSDMDAAIEVAKESDAVLLFLGLDQSQEREEQDRYETTLPGLQPQLLEGVLTVAGSKTIVVLIHGGIVSLGSIREKAGAILSAGYGGQAGASAIASVLFGDYNPTGKLATTVYPASFVDELPLTEMGLRVGVGRTYMYYTGKPEFHFGHGLSYSSWKLDWVLKDGSLAGGEDDATESTVPTLNVKPSVPAAFDVRIKNLGPSGSRQTILLFWEPVERTSNIRAPNTGGNESNLRKLQRKLVDFTQTSFLEVGESNTIFFQLEWKDFALWDSKTKEPTVLPGSYKLVAQVAGTQLTRLLEIASPPPKAAPERISNFPNVDGTLAGTTR